MVLAEISSYRVAFDSCCHVILSLRRLQAVAKPYERKTSPSYSRTSMEASLQVVQEDTIEWFF